jgi:CRISPR/Cas system CSM-associated protein Csm4 (group 5 of RAMP superfamily)
VLTCFTSSGNFSISSENHLTQREALMPKNKVAKQVVRKVKATKKKATKKVKEVEKKVARKVKAIKKQVAKKVKAITKKV